MVADEIDAAAGLTLRGLTTPGHTPHHIAYALEKNGTAVAVFTGGSLLIGTVGRPTSWSRGRPSCSPARSPAAAATGDSGDWVREGEAPGFLPARFVRRSRRPAPGEGVVVLDVRRASERAGGYIEGLLHIPIHALNCSACGCVTRWAPVCWSSPSAPWPRW